MPAYTVTCRSLFWAGCEEPPFVAWLAGFVVLPVCRRLILYMLSAKTPDVAA
ncbi:MAG: hypothetical protein O3B86_02035 [Planctomycetota bacterium]|nr:hypothetical protein [Planctomycetota bacterium]